MPPELLDRFPVTLRTSTSIVAFAVLHTIDTKAMKLAKIRFFILIPPSAMKY
jgi:hypothetical protein